MCRGGSSERAEPRAGEPLRIFVIDRDGAGRTLDRTEFRLNAPPRAGDARMDSALSARVGTGELARQYRVHVRRERPGDPRLYVELERSRAGDTRRQALRVEGTLQVPPAGDVVLGRVLRPDGGSTEVRVSLDSGAPEPSLTRGS